MTFFLYARKQTELTNSVFLLRKQKKVNRAFIEHLSMNSALSALQGVPDKPFQPLCLSQLPEEHYTGAVITTNASLYRTAYSRVLGWGNACKEPFLRTQNRPVTTRTQNRHPLIPKPSVYHQTTTPQYCCLHWHIKVSLLISNIFLC